MASSTHRDTDALIRNTGLAHRVLRAQNGRTGRRYKIILLYNRDDNTAGRVADFVTDFINKDIGEVMDYLPLGGFIILETIEAIVDSEVVIFLICQDFMKRGEFNLYRNIVMAFEKPVVMLPYEVSDDRLRRKWPECCVYRVIHLKEPLGHNIDGWQQQLTRAVPNVVYTNPCCFILLGRAIFHFIQAIFFCACSCIINERKKLEADTEVLNQAQTELRARERENQKAKKALDKEREENKKTKKALAQERKENRKNKEALDQERKENRKNKEAFGREREIMRIQLERIEKAKRENKKANKTLEQKQRDFEERRGREWQRIGEETFRRRKVEAILEKESSKQWKRMGEKEREIQGAKEALDQERKDFHEKMNRHLKEIGKDEREIQLAKAVLQRDRRITAEERREFKEEKLAFEQERKNLEENETADHQYANFHCVEDTGNLDLLSFKNELVTNQPTRSRIKTRKPRKNAGYYTGWQGVYDFHQVVDKATTEDKMVEPGLLPLNAADDELADSLLKKFRKVHDSPDFSKLSKTLEMMKLKQTKLEVKVASFKLPSRAAINTLEDEPPEADGNAALKTDPMEEETDQVDRDSNCEDSDSEHQPSDGLEPLDHQSAGSGEQPSLRDGSEERQMDLGQGQTTQEEMENLEEQAHPMASEVVSPINLVDDRPTKGTDESYQNLLLKNVKETDDGDHKPPEKPHTEPEEKLDSKESTPDKKEILEKDSKTSTPNTRGQNTFLLPQIPKARSEITSTTEPVSPGSAPIQ